MKRETRSFFLMLSLLVAGSLAYSTIRASLRGSRPEFLLEPTAQQREMAISKLTVEEADRVAGTAALESGAASELVGPLLLEPGPDESFLIIDEGASDALFEFSPAREALKPLEPLLESAPRSIVDADPRGDEVWLADLLGRSLYRLSAGERVWHRLPLPIEPYRIAWLGDGGRVAVLQLGAERLFAVFDARGNEISSFGDLLESQRESSLALDGRIASDGHHLYLAPRFLGVLAAFSEVGKLDYIVRTLAPPKPPVVVEKDGTRWLEHGPISATLSLSVAEGLVYLLSYRTHGATVRAFVDVYRAEDGQYQESLLLPDLERWSSLHVSGGTLWAASAQGIVRWEEVLMPTESQSKRNLPGRIVIHTQQTSNTQGE